MKTCKRLGIKTVAIYSEADANAVCFDKFWEYWFAGVIHTVLVKMLNKKCILVL